MTSLTANLGRTPLASLQRFVRRPRESLEICELCAKPLSAGHPHLLEPDKHRVACACDACAILFSGNTRQRYVRIPRDVYRLDQFAMDDHEWESLLIPINLAFFVFNSSTKRMVAQYPSPGGAMESALDLDYWSAIEERNPVLQKLEPDVEAFLVNRLKTVPQYFRVPIDRCFQLVGLIRTQWRGLSGGEQVWNDIDAFFRDLDQQSGAQGA